MNQAPRDHSRPAKTPPPRRAAHRTASAHLDGVGDGVHRQADDEATLAYIRRILCSRTHSASDSAVDAQAHHHVAAEPLDELLPPLTSSNAVDVQLYALIAVILSNFIQVWYNRITPDQQFVGEIIHIIAHCTRGLEQRLRHVDLEELLLDELPDLLNQHVDAIRTSHMSQIERRTTDETRNRFLALRPHIALRPTPLNASAVLEQQENELAWCLLIVNRILPLLLPPEDLQNPCLDVLVSEIFSELIFRGGICGKASEPWLIWDGVTKLLHTSAKARERSDSVPARPGDHEDVSISEGSLGRSRRRFEQMSISFWFVLQCAAALWALLRASLLILVQASAIPPRKSLARRPKTSGGKSLEHDQHAKRTVTPLPPMSKRPIIEMHIWGCISRLLLLDRRSPWLSGALSFAQWILLSGPGQLCSTNSRLDRLMAATFQDIALNPTRLPSVLQAARSALFPENSLAPARIPPTSDEIVQIRRDCAAAIVEAMPHFARVRFFATADEAQMREDVEAELLDLLADAYINKHLIVSAVELVAVRLFPELAVQT